VNLAPTLFQSWGSTIYNACLSKQGPLFLYNFVFITKGCNLWGGLFACLPSQFTRESLCELLSNLECWVNFVAFFFMSILPMVNAITFVLNRNELKLFLLWQCCFSCAFSKTRDTCFGFYFKVFSLTKISQDLLCLFENLRFFNVVSNNNVHLTLMIYISLWRKVFHHGDFV
jgi:hypothetical protein